jgi:hypothetical protein
MSDFGDFGDDDALDTAPADPEQVARKRHGYLLEHGVEIGEWDQLSDDDRAARVFVETRLLAWLRRQGSHP